MIPNGVRIVFHEGSPIDWTDTAERIFRYTVEPGWVHVHMEAGQVTRVFPVESYPSDAVRRIVNLYVVLDEQPTAAAKPTARPRKPAK